MGIRLYNYAAVPEGQVRTAEDAATRILKKAGIKVEWTACIGGSAAERKVHSTCIELSPSTDLTMYLVGPLEKQNQWIARSALGYSIIPEAPAIGTMAYVSYPRVRKLSVFTSANVAELLGLAMAHEIGHLLLQSRDHANQGIMRAPWRLKDLENKAWEEFEFTPSQSRRLRAAVRARLQGDKPAISA